MTASNNLTLDEALDVIKKVAELTGREIELALAAIKWEEVDKKVAIATLPLLSQQLQKSRDYLIGQVKEMSTDDRELFLSSLLASQVIEKLKLVISILERGGSGLALHTAAKISYGAAQVASCWANCAFCPVFCGIASAASAVGVTTDIIAENKDQQDSDKLGQTVDAINAKVDRLEAKADFIMDLPGDPKDQPPIPQVPPGSKPVSLTDIERKLDFIMDLPPGGEVPATPPDSQPVSLTDLEKKLDVTKKFYKFEGSFTPTFQADKTLITIKTGIAVPTLTTGFIDLTGMRQHDVVTITTKLLEQTLIIVGKFPVLQDHWIIWRVKTFSGPQVYGIKHLQDFADILELPGDGVEILITQAASASDFDPKSLITIPYQFVIESITKPSFTVVSPPSTP